MTPLVDLFLNILIFFLVTTTFSSDTVFYVDLPETTEAEQVGKAEQLSIGISAAGEIALNQKLVTLGELESRIGSIPENERSVLPVLIRADKNAFHGSVVQVIELVRKGGLTNLGIVTEQGK
jgi:biopolymer transport protein ExbD